MPLAAIAAKWAPTILSGLGGIFGRKDEKERFNAEVALQREFAQHGIRWRVEDAKAAGLHPLYAMGAQVPSYSPTFGGSSSVGASLSEMGQNVGRAVQSGMTADQRRMQDLQFRQLEGSIAESDARRSLLDAEAAKLRQESVASPPWPAYDESGQNVPGRFLPTNPEVFNTSIGDPSTSAGVNPMWSTFRLRGGRTIVLPSEMASQSLESLSESAVLMAITLAENNARFGDEGFDVMSDVFGFERAREAEDNLPWVLRMLDKVPGVRISRSQ